MKGTIKVKAPTTPKGKRRKNPTIPNLDIPISQAARMMNQGTLQRGLDHYEGKEFNNIFKMSKTERLREQAKHEKAIQKGKENLLHIESEKKKENERSKKPEPVGRDTQTSDRVGEGDSQPNQK